MKTRTRNTLLLSALVSSLILLGSGCSKKSVIAPESTGNTDGTSISYPSAENGDGYSENNLPVEGTLDDTSQSESSTAYDDTSDEYKMLHGRSSAGLQPIYFDFDQATVRPDMVERMLGNAEYLKQVPSSYIVVEANTDERGTNEYNLALAERRAQNTRQYLVDLGINPVRIRTISYGEEKPLFTEQTEAAFSQNRRADFVVE